MHLSMVIQVILTAHLSIQESQNESLERLRLVALIRCGHEKTCLLYVPKEGI